GGLSPSEAKEWGQEFVKAHEAGGAEAVTALDERLNQRLASDDLTAQRLEKWLSDERKRLDGPAGRSGQAIERLAEKYGLSPHDVLRLNAKTYWAYRSGDGKSVARAHQDLGRHLDDQRQWSNFNELNKTNRPLPVDPSSVEGLRPADDPGRVSGDQGHSSGSSHGVSSSGPAAGSGMPGKPATEGAAGEAAPVKGGDPTVVLDRPTAPASGNGKAQQIIDQAFKDGAAESEAVSAAGTGEHGAGEVGPGSSTTSHNGGEAGTTTPIVKSSDGEGQGLTSSGPVSKTGTKPGGGTGLADHSGGRTADHFAGSGAGEGLKGEAPGSGVGGRAEKKALNFGLSSSEAREWGE
ncbi:hypothetical protein AB0K82_44720, partial [Actinoallomurus sp. NPDC052274]